MKRNERSSRASSQPGNPLRKEPDRPGSSRSRRRRAASAQSIECRRDSDEEQLQFQPAGARRARPRCLVRRVIDAVFAAPALCAQSALVAGWIRIVTTPPTIVVGPVSGCGTSAVINPTPVRAAFYSSVDTGNTAGREWTPYSGLSRVDRQCWSHCRGPVQRNRSRHNERGSHSDAE